jgi:serine protease AprX
VVALADVTARRKSISFGWSLDFAPLLRARAMGALVVALGLAVIAPSTAAAANPYDPSQDPHSLRNVAAALGADAWWASGYTGAGVDVAIIDTGVSSVPCLDAPGKVIHGPDLSLESQAPNLIHLDSNGHGTAMAGLIAGACEDYLGIAPNARIVSLKVGVADGGVDVSQVIAAIDWVVQHKNDNGLNIRVLNLSYGTNSTQPYTIDPLAYAAEQAWHHGIVVVAAAGNSGYQRGKGAPGLASPAYDPYVIAVGATNLSGMPPQDQQSVSPGITDTDDESDDDSKKGKKDKDKKDKDRKRARWTSPQPAAGGDDEVVAEFSASGAGRNPDLVAPGKHMQLLRVPGSFVDQSLPPGQVFGNYFRGSGTSEAAAVVSGAAALVLQKFPTLSPDDVKRFLTSETIKIKGADDRAQGKGRLDLEGLSDRNPSSGDQHYDRSTGLGSLEISRGSDHLTLDGLVLSGERDIFGKPWVPATITPLEAAGTAWNGGTWNGSAWSGNSWSGNSWSGNSWSGNSWSGNSWSGNSWSGNSWSGNSWSGNSWSGNSWSGNSWSGHSWSGAGWN